MPTVILAKAGIQVSASARLFSLVVVLDEANMGDCFEKPLPSAGGDARAQRSAGEEKRRRANFPSLPRSPLLSSVVVWADSPT